jgi:chaperone BCS1
MDGFAPYLGPALGIALSSTMNSNSSNPTDIAQSLVEKVPGLLDAQQLIKKFTGLDVLYLAVAIFLLDGARRVISYLYKSVDRLLVSFFTSDITIDANDEIRDEILAWLAVRYKQRFGARSVMVYSGAMKQKRMRHPYLEERMTMKDDRETDISFTPSLGRHYFFPLGWRPFIFERDSKDIARSWSGQASSDLTIRCLGWSDKPLREFILLCKAFKKEKSKGRTMTYTFSTGRSGGYSEAGHWGVPYAAPSRNLATVELDKEIKDNIVNDITRYLEPKTAEFYKNNGIPYRRGYLLHGPPGTGKSSLSKALASHFNLALYCMNLGEEGIGDHNLRSAFAALPTKCIVLLEDIDSAGIGREKPVESQAEKDAINAAAQAGALPDGISADDFSFSTAYMGRGMARITLSGLLNALDGASASEGRIVIMTSNHPEVLDSALIRPGRVDKRILLPDMSRTSARKIFTRMYSNTDVQNVAELAKTFAKHLPEGKITPAELQGFILDRMDMPLEAVDDVEAWANNVIAEKEREQEKKQKRLEALKVAKEFQKKEEETLQVAKAAVAAQSLSQLPVALGEITNGASDANHEGGPVQAVSSFETGTNGVNYTNGTNGTNGMNDLTHVNSEAPATWRGGEADGNGLAAKTNGRKLYRGGKRGKRGSTRYGNDSEGSWEHDD